VKKKRKQMRAYLAAVLTMAASIVPNKLCLGQGLVQNGSFELGYSFSGWTLSGGAVNLGGPGAGVQCADGYNAVGLDWQSTLYQDVPTVIGQRYDFRFYMADWFTDSVHSNVVSLNVSFGSTSLGTVSFSGAGKSFQNMGWQRFDYAVTATTASSRIAFFNPGAFDSDTRFSMIDEVSLTAIPEPSMSVLLFLGLLMALSSYSRRRHIQWTRR
jgi:hypothetical protein